MVRVNWAFNEGRFHRNENYPKPKIYVFQKKSDSSFRVSVNLAFEKKISSKMKTTQNL
jgi:hypothetical protein